MRALVSKLRDQLVKDRKTAILHKNALIELETITPSAQAPSHINGHVAPVVKLKRSQSQQSRRDQADIPKTRRRIAGKHADSRSRHSWPKLGDRTPSIRQVTFTQSWAKAIKTTSEPDTAKKSPATLERVLKLAQDIKEERGRQQDDTVINKDEFAKILTHENLESSYKEITLQFSEMKRHLDEAFEVLSINIQLKDSAESKRQTKKATALTVIATIYLPATLAVGVFGMNVDVLGGQVGWKWPVITFAAMFAPSALTLLVLFFWFE